MSPGIVALVLLAAVIHVTWNVLLKAAVEPLRFATVANTMGALALAPIALVVWLALGADPIPGRAFLLATIAGALEVCYFSFLTAAYRRGDVSVVYPIARGTAPLLSVIIGLVILGERLGVSGTLGVVTLLSGVLSIRRPWLFLRRSVREDNPRLSQAAAFAFATGVAIASYSAIDRTGARTTEPWIYAALLSVTTAVGLWLRLLVADYLWPSTSVGASAGGQTVAGPQRSPDAAPRDPLRVALLVGVFSYTGYALILFAYRHAPLTAVAPLRESAVVFASSWGTLRLREGHGIEAVWRLGGACLIVLGIFLLAWDGT